MRLAFHQPNYLPNLSFFYKMASVDLFVIPTSLQFVRREWQSRAKLKGPGGSDLLLTVPVLGPSRQTIGEARVNDGEPWRHKHARTLKSLYGKTAEQELLPKLLEMYDKPCDRLVDVNMAFIHTIRDALGITTPIVVDEEISGHKHELLIGLCSKYQADTYLSGLGGKLYMDEAYLAACDAAGIAIEFVARNVTGEYPYSAAHYVLSSGLAASRRVVLADESGSKRGAPDYVPVQTA